MLKSYLEYEKTTNKYTNILRYAAATPVDEQVLEVMQPYFIKYFITLQLIILWLET